MVIYRVDSWMNELLQVRVNQVPSGTLRALTLANMSITLSNSSKKYAQ